MSEMFKIHEEDSKEYFYTVADRKNQITFDKFLEYMNAMTPQEKWFLFIKFIKYKMLNSVKSVIFFLAEDRG